MRVETIYPSLKHQDSQQYLSPEMMQATYNLNFKSLDNVLSLKTRYIFLNSALAVPSRVKIAIFVLPSAMHIQPK